MPDEEIAQVELVNPPSEIICPGCGDISRITRNGWTLHYECAGKCGATYSYEAGKVKFFLDGG